MDFQIQGSPIRQKGQVNSFGVRKYALLWWITLCAE